MTNSGHKPRSSDRGRLMFEHVDRHGRGLLPLTQETQKILALGILGTSVPDGLRPDDAGTEVRTATQSFTAREWQVFDLLITGLSSKQIAYKLGISSRTV